MTELCLIRHGETDWNLQGLTQGSTDIPLNELGREQARVTGDFLATESWDAIYASDLSRARETASIIGKSIGIPDVACDRRLRERSFGAAEGMGTTERKVRFPDRNAIPGAELWEDVRRRGLTVLAEIAGAHRGERVLVVSHGGVLISVLSHLSDGAIVPGRPPLKNLSMSRLVFDGAWRIDSFNRVAPELEDEAVSA